MFQRCLFLSTMDVRYDDEQAIVMIDNRALRFSPGEYKVMRLLLTQPIATEAALREALLLQGEDKATTKLIAKYMYKVRSKVRAADLDISRVHGHGYMLLPIQSEKQTRISP